MSDADTISDKFVAWCLVAALAMIIGCCWRLTFLEADRDYWKLKCEYLETSCGVAR